MPEGHSTETISHIPNFPGYGASKTGRIWSQRTPQGTIRVAWKPLSPGDNGRGYLFVYLRKDGKSIRRYIHQLIMETFVGPCPDGMEVCHDPDSSRANNHLDNLRYDPRPGNFADKRHHGTHREGEAINSAKLTESAVAEIRRSLARKTASRKELALRHAVSIGTIDHIFARKTWKHVV